MSASAAARERELEKCQRHRIHHMGSINMWKTQDRCWGIVLYRPDGNFHPLVKNENWANSVNKERMCKMLCRQGVRNWCFRLRSRSRHQSKASLFDTSWNPKCLTTGALDSTIKPLINDIFRSRPLRNTGVSRKVHCDPSNIECDISDWSVLSPYRSADTSEGTRTVRNQRCQNISFAGLISQ